MSSDLQSKVLQWMQCTGFPLEMEAAAAFREAGFDVRQAVTYSDPQLEKSREIDAVATDPGTLGVVEIHFAIECKASNKPWVVLCSDKGLAGYSRIHVFSLMSQAALRVSHGLLTYPEGESREFMNREDRCGYGFREALASKDSDAAYTAAVSALKGSRSLIRDRIPAKPQPITFAFPVVVVDAPLFECSLGATGEIEVIEVSQSSFLFSTHIPMNVGCLVHVVTRTALHNFAQKAKQIATALRSDLRHEERKAL